MKTRIISAIIASILAIIILIFHNTIIFYFAISALTVAMVYEMFSALKCLQFKFTSAICFVFAAVMPMLLYKDLYKLRYPFLVITIILIFITYLIQFKTLSFDKLSIMLCASVLITLAMSSLLEIKIGRQHGLFLLILSLCGAWLADSGAYFAGTLFGKHKLCPEISPKKTIEGLIGGTITNAILFVGIGLLFSYIQSLNDKIININYVYIAILGMICSLLGLLGDLTASFIKRQCQINDYINFMPGHGGVLDRFDSVLFVVPFMTVVTKYIDLIK